MDIYTDRRENHLDPLFLSLEAYPIVFHFGS